MTLSSCVRWASRSTCAICESLRRYSIMGALKLYLDFINLFLMLLRIFGNRR
nr:Inner membrane protein YbhL [Candidatus Pantoea persica]